MDSSDGAPCVHGSPAPVERELCVNDHILNQLDFTKRSQCRCRKRAYLTMADLQFQPTRDGDHDRKFDKFKALEKEWTASGKVLVHVLV